MWFRTSAKNRRVTSAQPHRSPYRPRLEPLEDRCLMSAGALDPTFGAGGIVTTSLSQKTNDYGHRVAVQPDGKILVVGEVNNGGSEYGLARYTANGSLDTSFGKGGSVVLGPSGAHVSNTFGFFAWDVALQPDGKIDVASYYNWAVLQFNANGSLDTTFGNKGQVNIPMSGFPPAGSYSENRLAIQPPAAGSTEGKIVVVGVVNLSAGLVGLARLNPGGSLDSTFGSGGTVETTIDPGSGYMAALNSVTLQSDGKIVVAGTAGPGSPTASNPRFFVGARYNANGSLDGSFGSGGIVTTVLAALPRQGADAVIVQPGDGKIVAIGFASDNGSTRDWGLVRYNSDGSLDTSFGSGGIVLTATTGTAVAAAFGSDGNIVVAGSASGSFAVGRYFTQATTVNGVTYAAGSLDPTFGSNGIATTSVGVAGSDAANGIAIQPDGKVVVAGYAQVGSYNQFAVLRYLASAPQIGSFTASPNPVTSGSTTALIAANLTDGNPNSTITQVAFYVQINGTNTLLGYGAQTSPGMWTFSYTVNLAPGSYTLFAQGEDSYGVFGDLMALTLTVQ
jgi:uncharacterized delta-60 repeat protein